jgi:hypothetical protein
MITTRVDILKKEKKKTFRKRCNLALFGWNSLYLSRIAISTMRNIPTSLSEVCLALFHLTMSIANPWAFSWTPQHPHEAPLLSVKTPFRFTQQNADMRKIKGFKLEKRLVRASKWHLRNVQARFGYRRINPPSSKSKPILKLITGAGGWQTDRELSGLENLGRVMYPSATSPWIGRRRWQYWRDTWPCMWGNKTVPFTEFWCLWFTLTIPCWWASKGGWGGV